jgi:hypothetical protein
MMLPEFTLSGLSVNPSACMSAAPTGRISVKLDIGNFHENLSRKSKFGVNRANISGTLHEYLSFIVADDITSP